MYTWYIHIHTHTLTIISDGTDPFKTNLTVSD